MKFWKALGSSLRSSTMRRSYRPSSGLLRIQSRTHMFWTVFVFVYQREKPLVGLRWILVILGSIAYFIQLVIRSSFPVALVAMVKPDINSSSSADYSRDSCVAANEVNNPSIHEIRGKTFAWSTAEQGFILGGYFWGAFVSRLLLSHPGERLGQRAFMALGLGVGGALALLAPLAAKYSPYALAAVRICIGIALGPLPSINHSLLSAWAPRHELSSMITFTYTGSTFGGTLGLILSGWLSDTYGWEVVFWMNAALAFFFIPIWIIVVRNTPNEHPWLSDYEKTILQENQHISTKKFVPWKKILLSPYPYVCIIAYFTRVWVDTMMTTEGPSFFHYKLGLSISHASYICGSFYLCGIVFMLPFGRICDYIIKKNHVRKITARRLFHFIGAGIPCLFLLGMCFAECDTTTVIILYILTGAAVSATACSYPASIIDFAPNHTAILMGGLAFGTLAGPVTPLITAIFLGQENGWNKAYYLTAAMSLLSCLVYIPFITADAQPWNYDQPTNDQKVQEDESTKKK